MGRAASTLSARFDRVVANISGSATDGVNCQSNASANTKGTWVTNAAYKPPVAWNLMHVSLINANAGDFTVDVGVDDGAGNVFILCPDLRCPGLKIAKGGMAHYWLPLQVPAGRQLAFRCQSSTGNQGCRVSIGGSSIGIGGAQGYARMVSLYTVGTSRGVAIDPGATAHVKGSWTQLVASTADRIGGLMMAVGHNNDTARTTSANIVLDLGIGAAASERVLLPDVLFAYETNLDQWMPTVAGPFPCDLPAGVRLAARAQSESNVAGDRTLDLALWGFVP